MAGYCRNLLKKEKMTRFSALWNYRCPNCEKGSIYQRKDRFWFGKMHDKCQICEHKFDKEPGFFFGAMYVSYGLNVAEGIATFIICQFFFASFFDRMMVPILLVVIILLSGFNYTLSRVIWIYFFTQKGQSLTQQAKKAK